MFRREAPQVSLRSVPHSLAEGLLRSCDVGAVAALGIYSFLNILEIVARGNTAWSRPVWNYD